MPQDPTEIVGVVAGVLLVLGVVWLRRRRR
jgi:hypothetical protein